MNYSFKTRDCPDANGRVPDAGERRWRFEIPLEDGGTLTLFFGKEGMDCMKEVLEADFVDDATNAWREFLIELAEERHMMHGANPDGFWGCTKSPCRRIVHFLRSQP